MRVVFLGNTLDYSPGFLEALAARSADPSDPVELLAVVCPQRFETPRSAALFKAKRRVGNVLEQFPGRWLPGRVNQRVSALAGRWQRMHSLAQKAGARILWPSSPADKEACRFVRSLNADLAIMAGLNRILKDRVFESFPPVFNIHPSLLPEFRGGVPEFWQVDAGEKEGGVTLHRAEPGVDTGAIVLQKRFPIEPWVDSDELIALSVSAGVQLMNEFLDGFPTVAESPTLQQGGSYQPLPRAEDSLLAFDRPASDVFNRARAVGWGSPLVTHVPEANWRDQAELQCSKAASAGALALELYDPVPFVDHTSGPPGKAKRTQHGGVAVTCSPGTILFRRALLRTS
jgi:methionyl-tRNA formyltransferase